jgi:hypothetical protein
MEIAAEAKLKGLNRNEIFNLMIERIEDTLPALAVHKELEAHPEEYGLERVYYNKDEDAWFWTYKDNSTPSPSPTSSPTPTS